MNASLIFPNQLFYPNPVLSKHFRVQSEAEVIAEVLEKMGMNSDKLSLQEKLDALCLIFKKTIEENAK